MDVKGVGNLTSHDSLFDVSLSPTSLNDRVVYASPPVSGGRHAAGIFSGLATGFIAAAVQTPFTPRGNDGASL